MRMRSTDAGDAVAQQVAAEIRVEMARQGISQLKLASKLGWHQPRLSRRLNNSPKHPLVPLEVDELVAVAAALGVSVTQLLPAEQVAA